MKSEKVVESGSSKKYQKELFQGHKNNFPPIHDSETLNNLNDKSSKKNWKELL